MKKLLTTLMLLGAVAGGAAYFAKRRGQDLGELAGDLAGRAREVASSTAENVDAGVGDTAESLKASTVDLRDEVRSASQS